MEYDRRTLLSVMAAGAALPGCARAQPVSAGWADFAARFLAPDGRVIDTGNGNISHSEGQGYGLLFAEAAGDRVAFDRIWNWTRQTLARSDVNLFVWRYDPTVPEPMSDPNNATDGDMLIAWALSRAASRWGGADYAEQSGRIRAAVLARLVRPFGGRTLLLPGLQGFAASDHMTINPSYYVWPALDAFATADANSWRTLIADGERLMKDMRFGSFELPTDWVDVAVNGVLAPAAGRPPRFGFDAIRVPLYLIWSGRTNALGPYRRYWKTYFQQKRLVPAWIDVTDGKVAPYALSPGGASVAHLVVDGYLVRAGGDYYSTALADLAALAARR